MPVNVNLIQGGIGIVFLSDGIVLGREIIEANRTIYTRENLLRLKYKIIDRTNCTEYCVSGAEMQTIAAQDQIASEVNPNILFLHIATTPVQYGMIRMWQAYIDETGLRSEIFEDRASADAWLKDNLRCASQKDGTEPKD